LRADASFAATFVYGKDLARVQQAGGIQGVVHTAHEGEVRVGEEQGHEFALFHANAVLSGETAANLNAVANDCGGSLEGALVLLRVARIVEHDGVEIAITGVKDVADSKAELLTDLLNAAQSLREFGARDDAVQDIDTGGDAPEGPEGILAAFPEKVALFVVAGDADFASLVNATDFVDGRGLRGHRFGDAFDFNE
jgi:hypothetical protein